jgi:hypothetical protein
MSCCIKTASLLDFTFDRIATVLLHWECLTETHRAPSQKEFLCSMQGLVYIAPSLMVVPYRFPQRPLTCWRPIICCYLFCVNAISDLIALFRSFLVGVSNRSHSRAYRCGIAALLLQCRCGIAVVSLRFRCGLSLFSRRCRQVSVSARRCPSERRT